MCQAWANRRKVNFRETSEKCFLCKVIREVTVYELLMRIGTGGHSWCFDIPKIITRAYKSLTTHACISLPTILTYFALKTSECG